MFDKSNTRIIFVNGSVVVLRQVQLEKTKCRMFIDGVEKGYLVKVDGILKPEDDQSICLEVLSTINDMARRSKASY